MTLGGGSSGAAFVGAGDDADTRYQYRMDYRERGRFIIINNRTFQQKTGMNERSGTDKDAASLFTDFKQLGFDVTLKHNQTASQMLDLMIDGEMFCCAVLSLTFIVCIHAASDAILI